MPILEYGVLVTAFKFHPIADKEIKIKPEISLGQVITILFIVIGAAGVIYTSIAKVDRVVEKVDVLENNISTYADKETVTRMANDMAAMRHDVSILTQYIVDELTAQRAKIRTNQSDIKRESSRNDRMQTHQTTQDSLINKNAAPKK